MQRVHVFFSGIVQGVGFRFMVQRFAFKLDLKGWVKNLSDGKVEIVVEGEKDKINELISQLKNEFDGSIENVDIEISEPTNEFKSFSIVF